jgi:hypothetical protein
VHGVVCNDGFSISFQPYQKDWEAVLHHHPHSTADKSSIAPVNGHRQNGVNGVNASSPPKPIEFRRKVLMKHVPIITREGPEDVTSPMTKLLKEQEKLSQPQVIPVVEVYPVKLNYTVIDGKNQNPSHGFVLVSQRTKTHDALQDLMKIAAPMTSSSCKRVWSMRVVSGTQKGDGFEAVELSSLGGKLMRKGEDEKPAEMLTGEWWSTHGDTDAIKEMDVLVEVKRPNETWPRQSLELENRIQVSPIFFDICKNSTFLIGRNPFCF